MSKPSIVAIIIGIDGWEKYTLPLIESIQQYEPGCQIVVVDNESNPPYPEIRQKYEGLVTTFTKRCSYSAAINWGFDNVQDYFSAADWYIVLSNDVLCTGPFAHVLAGYGDDTVVGPLLKEVHGFPYLEGWCMAFSRRAWDAIGGFDERFLGSDYEDVAASTKARQEGFWLVEDLPFKHLDQRQRFYIIDDFAGKNAHNRDLFLSEYAGVRV